MKPRSVRLPFGKGRVLLTPDVGEGFRSADDLFDGHLTARIRRANGEVSEYDFGSGLVTDAGVAFMATDFNTGSTDITNFNQHDCGTGTTAAAVGQTALVTPAGTSRVAGTKSNPAANQFRTVATISFTSTLAITEWGLFSAASAGTMWDRRVFSAINVVNGDSIEFTYTLTINSGG